MIETLILRVNRPKGIEVTQVTPENYDTFEFKDLPYINQSNLLVHFLRRVELLDENEVKNNSETIIKK